MNPIKLVTFLFAFFCIVSCKENSNQNTVSKTENKVKKPNIIIFYVDDLGYGDVSSYGAVNVSTPNVDKLAKGGIKYTDAHSTAATCTPSRYSLLTGQYAFRNNAAILAGDAPLIISPNTPTIPSMLKKAGYKTAVVGKWHLGLGDGNVDWNQEIKPGPLEIGFDYSYLIPATGDRVPAIFLENHTVVNHTSANEPIVVNYKEKIGNMPVGTENPELLRQKADGQHSNTIINGISRIGFMDGGEDALWVDEEFPDILTTKAKDFIHNVKDDPFFLFFSFHDIHVPRLPNKRFIGKSTMGVRGDAIAQMDWITGEIINELEHLGIDKNTMFIFTSDNGPVLNDGYQDEAIEKLGDHKPSGIYRGGKYSAFEAGTRVPTIVYWPDTVQPGESDALWSQVDIYASLAAITGQKLIPEEAIDSKDLSQLLLSSKGKGREYMVEESYTFSLRKNTFKYIEPLSKEKNRYDWIEKNKGIESGFESFPQLFDLSTDPEEQHNIAEKNPELVKAMQLELNKIKERKTREF